MDAGRSSEVGEMARQARDVVAGAEGQMTRTEDQIQISMVQWLEQCVAVPPIGPWWTAVNPIAHKSRSAAGRSKAMGMKAGTPDLIMCWKGRFIGIEVKPPGKYLSPVQRDTHMAITTNGGVTVTVRSIDELEGTLNGLGVPMHGKVAA